MLNLKGFRQRSEYYTSNRKEFHLFGATQHHGEGENPRQQCKTLILTHLWFVKDKPMTWTVSSTTHLITLQGKLLTLEEPDPKNKQTKKWHWKQCQNRNLEDHHPKRNGKLNYKREEKDETFREEG